MGRGKKALCLLAFSLVCIGLLLFLHAFTVEHNTVTYLEWSAASVASPEGEETPFDPLFPPPALGEGQVYRFRTALPPQDGTQALLFEVDGMELAVYAGGELLYRSAAEFPSETMGQGTMQLPLPPGQGQELVMEVRPVGEGPDIFPPFPRLTDDPTDMDGVTAYANRLALPAGAAALALVLVWGLFLISLLHGQPNWSLIPLSLAALGLTVFRLSQGVGGFFLPQPVLVVCQWRGLGVLTSAALLVYLLMNRRRGFYRSFGLAALVSAGILLFACLLSLPFGGGLPRYLVSQIHALLQTGFYDGLSTWITLWLTAVCALLSAAETVRTLAQTRAQARAARIQYQLTLENYQQSLEKNRQTAALRHEWKNQVAALRLMAQRGDLSALEQRLEGLEGDLRTA